MHQLSDNELDRLSQQAAEQFDIEQNTSGWERLEQHLNQTLPVKKDSYRNRFLLFFLILVLLSGSSVYLFYNGNFESNRYSNNPPKNINKISGNKNLSHDKNNSDLADAPKSIDKIGEPKTIKGTESQLSIVRDQSAKLSRNAKKIFNSNQLHSTQFNNLIYRNEKKGITTSRPIAAENKVLNPSDQDNNNGVGEGGSANTPSRLKSFDLSSYSIKNRSSSSINIPIKMIPGPGENQKNTQKKINRPSNKLPIYASVVFGPDLTTVRFTHSDKPGFNAGIQVGYYFSKRWSVNTGVVYTKKNYTADGSDYHPPKNAWTNNTKFHMVQGYCSMFDVPLNVRYDALIRRTNTIFLSGGLSTYFMNGETYEVHYTNNGTYMIGNWTYNTNKNHIFSIINFSAGVEKSLNRNFSIGAEPYVKLPLTGLGYGSMQLNSYGIYLTLRYRPTFSLPLR